MRFLCRDAASLPEGAVDVAFAFECVHDMANPVGALAAMRKRWGSGPLIAVLFFGDGYQDLGRAALYGTHLCFDTPLLRVIGGSIQDVFGWRDRINDPGGSSARNWTWRLPWLADRLSTEPAAMAMSAQLREWSRRHGRMHDE